MRIIKYNSEIVYFINILYFSVLMKTIVMMAGELDFEDTFYKNESTVEYSEKNDDIIKYPVTAHIMFIAFVLLVTIILTNLLVGLAVSDIQVISVIMILTCMQELR